MPCHLCPRYLTRAAARLHVCVEDTETVPNPLNDVRAEESFDTRDSSPDPLDDVRAEESFDTRDSSPIEQPSILESERNSANSSGEIQPAPSAEDSFVVRSNHEMVVNPFETSVNSLDSSEEIFQLDPPRCLRTSPADCPSETFVMNRPRHQRALRRAALVSCGVLLSVAITFLVIKISLLIGELLACIFVLVVFIRMLLCTFLIPRC